MSDGVIARDADVPDLAAQFDPDTADWVNTTTGRRLATGGLRLGRALRDPGVAVPAGILVLLVVACFAGPALFGVPNPTTGDLEQYLRPLGTPGHLLGTNQLGNDMLSRMLYGGRVSIEIGLAATAISLVVGVAVGAFCGYLGGAADAIVMRILDILFAFPNIVLAMAIAAYLGPSVVHTIAAISVFGIAGFGRLARAQTVKIRQLDYVVAARSGGASTWRIVTTHIVPGISGPLYDLRADHDRARHADRGGPVLPRARRPDPAAELGEPHLLRPELRRAGPAAAHHARGCPVRDDRIHQPARGRARAATRTGPGLTPIRCPPGANSRTEATRRQRGL